jgi:hypothetical protein
MLDRPPPARRSRAAEAKARWRRREATGKIVLRVEVHEHDLARALLEAHRLTEQQATERRELEAAVQTLVEDFCGRWRRS